MALSLLIAGLGSLQARQHAAMPGRLKYHLPPDLLSCTQAFLQSHLIKRCMASGSRPALICCCPHDLPAIQCQPC